MLGTMTERLWGEYLHAEQDRIRDVMKQALDRFIDALLREDEQTWQRWARDFAAGVSDRSVDIPIRFPLFRRVLLPALTEGVLRRLPGCARWLAHFELHLLNVQEVGLPEHLRTAVGLLLEAIRVDDADQLARERLVQHWASYLQYTLHALPAGVLYGHNGASAAECDELIELLKEFRAHVQAIHQTQRFAELNSECDLHFEAYRDYLLQGRSGGSYVQFVELRRPAGRCS